MVDNHNITIKSDNITTEFNSDNEIVSHTKDIY